MTFPTRPGSAKSGYNLVDFAGNVHPGPIPEYPCFHADCAARLPDVLAPPRSNTNELNALIEWIYEPSLIARTRKWPIFLIFAVT